MSSSPSASSTAFRAIGLATAALAGFTLLKTLSGIENPNAKKRYITSGSDPSTNPYETQQSVYEYLLMHFGTQAELMNFPAIQSSQLQSSMNFPRECAEICGRYLQKISGNQQQGLRALDVGCSVGRSTFELTRFADQVIGLDYSQAFIDAANLLKSGGSLDYTMRTEGDLVQRATARVDPTLKRQNASFIQGDATNLLASFPNEQFHVILAANLLCRLPFPRRFLDACSRLIVEGGYLVMPSPYTWLEQYTPKSEWIGGYVDKNGCEVKSFDGIKAILEKDGLFELVERFDKPFFIRETARKNQWSVSDVTVWRRTAKTSF